MNSVITQYSIKNVLKNIRFAVIESVFFQEMGEVWGGVEVV